MNTAEAKENFLSQLREKIKRDPGKAAALEYLNDFNGRFWCEADERVREITDRFQEAIDEEAKAQLNVPIGSAEAGVSTGTIASRDERTELANRFQRIVNDTQLPRLNKMIKVLDDDILGDDQHHTYVIIDDLDRDWVADEKVANDLIRCLFRTVLDLQRVSNLKVVVALRTNIFNELDFGRTGGQEEKFRALILQMRWNKYDLVSMLDERVKVAADLANLGGIESLADLLPRPHKTHGKAVDFILDRTLMRPRDAIAYVNECIAKSAGKPTVTWNAILDAEQIYSHKRLLALRDEWKPNYPGIDQLFELFRGETMPMTRDAFQVHLDDAMILSATDRSFSGGLWLTELSEPMWSGAGEDWSDLYFPLTHLLFRVGFLGVSPSSGPVPVYSHEDPAFVDRADTLNVETRFYVHPTFHAALDIKGKVRRRGS